MSLSPHAFVLVPPPAPPGTTVAPLGPPIDTPAWVTPDGAHAVLLTQSALRVWNIRDAGRALAAGALFAPTAAPSVFFATPITQMQFSFSSDGTVFAARNGEGPEIRVWRISSSAAAAFSPSSPAAAGFIAAASGMPAPTATLSLTASDTGPMAVSPAGDYIVVGTSSGELQLADPFTGEVLAIGTGAHTVMPAFIVAGRAGGGYLASATVGDTSEMALWAVTRGASRGGGGGGIISLRLIAVVQGEVTALVMSPDERYLAAFPLSLNSYNPQLFDVAAAAAAGSLAAAAYSLDALPKPAAAASFSPDSARLMVVVYEETVAYVYNIAAACGGGREEGGGGLHLLSWNARNMLRSVALGGDYVVTTATSDDFLRVWPVTPLAQAAALAARAGVVSNGTLAEVLGLASPTRATGQAAVCITSAI